MKRKTERDKFEALYAGWDPKTLRRDDGSYGATWLSGAWFRWKDAKRQAKRKQRSKK